MVQMAKTVAVFEDVDAQCFGEASSGKGTKQQAILIAHRAGPFHGVTLMFNRATHEEIDALTKQLNRLGLNEVKVEVAT
jgi:hypothetical protein